MYAFLDRAHALRNIDPAQGPAYNCAQAVIGTFAEAAGISDEMARRLGANFGGGMKRGSVCGAVTGALVVFGLFDLSEPKYLQAFYKRFSERHHGLWDCKDLLRENAATGTPKKQHCDSMVYESVEAIEEILRESGKI